MQPPLRKVTPSFPATLSKNWGPLKPPFFLFWKFGWRLNPHSSPLQKGRMDIMSNNICLWYGTLWFFDRKDSVRPIWCGGFFQKYFCILILISNFEFRIFVIIIATILHHDTWLSIGRLHSDCYMICDVALINYFI